VSIVAPKTTIDVASDLKEKVGRPNMPLFYRPRIEIWDPRPTSSPERMSLRVEMLFK
jgi:hypothetical protein